MVFHQNRYEPRLLALSVWARCSLAVDFPTAPTVSMRLSRNSQWRRVSNPRADLVLVCSRLAARFADVRNFPAFFRIIPVATAPSHESCPRRSKLLSLVIEHDFPWSVISSNLRKNTLRYPFKCLHLVCCLSRWNKKLGNANVSQWRSLEKPGLRRKVHTGLIICFAAYGMSLCAHALLLLVCLFVSCCIALQTQWRCNVLKSNYENSTNLVCMLSAGSRLATAENWNKSKRLIAVILKGLDNLTKMQIVESPDFFLLYRPF